ncbi:protein kinase family protein [Streptomyces buecherae]|uniref:protein kinase family protein n=1 Tax=Streptomyces buecherae TaxID=2763006 RepID=UPI00364F177C
MRRRHPAERRAARVSAWRTIGAALSRLDDRRIADLLAGATPLGSGIGGRSAGLEVEGVPVFVKRVPLTERELRPEHARSTANLFGLPTWYQYGVGSAGFGAWRELATHTLTTRWVLADAYQGFPLTYHWRVLPDTPPEGFVAEFGGIDGAVAHWEGSPAVRARLEAIGRAPASLVLFLEYVPHTLAGWLDERRGAPAAGGHDPLLEWVEGELAHGAAFLRARRVVHFDAHFANVLTDGDLLYFADFGLALSSRFTLSVDESRFLTEHLAYDHAYTASHLLRHHVLADLRDGGEYRRFLRDWLAGRPRPVVSAARGALVDRHARVALLLHDFHHDLLTVSKRTPFPAARLRRGAMP